MYIYIYTYKYKYKYKYMYMYMYINMYINICICISIEYCFARFISGRLNCHGNREMETKSSKYLCQKLLQSFIKCVGDIHRFLKELYYMNLPCVAAV